jgi:hypothetical protein
MSEGDLKFVDLFCQTGMFWFVINLNFSLVMNISWGGISAFKLYSRIIPVAKHSIQAKKYDINHFILSRSRSI